MAEATTGKQTQEGQNKLQAGLKRRHMTMISLGGIIGAGLFVGTGPILNQAGPATILTYALTGTLLILIMRMLGEMAVARPSVGSFSDYGRMALGNSGPGSPSGGYTGTSGPSSSGSRRRLRPGYWGSTYRGYRRG